MGSAGDAPVQRSQETTRPDNPLPDSSIPLTLTRRGPHSGLLDPGISPLVVQGTYLGLEKRRDCLGHTTDGGRAALERGSPDSQ